MEGDEGMDGRHKVADGARLFFFSSLKRIGRSLYWLTGSLILAIIRRWGHRVHHGPRLPPMDQATTGFSNAPWSIQISWLYIVVI